MNVHVCELDSTFKNYLIYEGMKIIAYFFLVHSYIWIHILYMPKKEKKRRKGERERKCMSTMMFMMIVVKACHRGKYMDVWSNEGRKKEAIVSKKALYIAIFKIENSHFSSE